jgi:hypothetical protein
VSERKVCEWCEGIGCPQCGYAGYYEILSAEEVEQIEEQARKDYESRAGRR